MATPSIQIVDKALAHDAGGLLAVLEHLFPVRFQARGSGGGSLLGQIASGVDGDAPADLPVSWPTLILPAATGGSCHVRLAPTCIQFADDPEVPWPYRGRSITIRAELDPALRPAIACPGDLVLAADAEGRPIWTVANRNGIRVHRTALRAPHSPLGSDVGLAAGEERFVQALPLFHFLREVSGPSAFANPPLRAAYIIDDPNLHWTSYGYADYRAIAASARLDRYHVAFATIPLDAWWVHGKAAEIFRTHADGLSLLIHGNNHARHELARNYSSEAISALLQQAIARIRQVEARSGLAVSRVMVPPHGACSARMLAELPTQGFESACISAGSLRAHNVGQAWTRTLGLAPSEFVKGCPVLPRWAFGNAGEGTLLAAAYLGQPLILRGHHQDLKGGLDLFREYARAINSLGDVRWDSLAKLSRLNYRHRVEGTTLHVQPLGTRVTVEVPEGIEAIQIEAGGFDWRALEPQTTLDCTSGCSAVVSVVGGRAYDFARHTLPASVVQPNATSAKLILRRVVTEARDRLRLG